MQTTRALVRGIALQGAAQVILVDTPGIFAPKRRLDRAMVHSAWSGAADADAVCLLVDARKGVDAEVEAVLGRLKDVKREKILILNKIDLIPREKLLALAAQLNAASAFAETFMISALNGDGVGDLRRALAARMPAGPWLYPEDQVSDAPLRSIVLGKGGQTIKAIGQAARIGIAEAADAKVHLFLHVKVRENWADDPARYREMGLEFPRG